MTAFTRFSGMVAVLLAAAPLSTASASQSKLAEIHGLCAPHADTLVSTEVPCTKAMINASADQIFNAKDPATQLYLIEADKLLHSIEVKRVSETDAREKLLKMLLALEDRHRPDLMAIQAQKENELAAAQRDQQQAHEVAEKDERIADNRRANAEMIEAAQNRAFQKQHDDLVAFCVATANQRIHANPLWYNANFFSGIHPDKSCDADPYWYKTIPSLQSQVGGRVN
jgi:hypothetical protein